MLDAFEILTSSGVVLWSKTYTPVSASVINSFINNVFIEERTQDRVAISSTDTAEPNAPFNHDKYTLRWTAAKDVGLIFVVRLYLTFALLY